MQPTTPGRRHVVEKLLAKPNQEGGPKRPFNPDRIWSRSRVKGPPHIFLMNDKGKLITQEMKRGEPEEELTNQTNVFMDTYREILPKEYRMGLIPMKKRKFLIDKEKGFNVTTLMKPKLKPSAENLYYVPDDNVDVDIRPLLAHSEFPGNSQSQPNRKFAKGYSVDQGYSLDRGIGYPQVGQEKRQPNQSNTSSMRASNEQTGIKTTERNMFTSNY
jgi:hypothetical protein